jgi:hypothetical protein
MLHQQLLDSQPLIVLLVFALAMLVAYEVGFRLGRWWQRRTPGEQEGPTGMLVGSLVALMSFLLAITMGMAADRFDDRRGLILEEANAIQTAYLRAGYLPMPAGEQVRELLREYAPLRIVNADLAQLALDISRSEAIHGEVWAITEDLVRTTDQTDTLALYVEAINEVINVHERRLAAAWYARVPETISLLLLVGSILALGLVGYSSGISERRSVVSAVALVVALSVVTVLVLDIDRPRDGLIQVSQQPLIDVARDIGAPSS